MAEGLESRMSRRQCERVLAVFFFAMAKLIIGNAIAGVLPDADYQKRIRAVTTLQPVRHSDFGEELNLFTGEPEFSLPIIDIPGNSSLKVSWTERYNINVSGPFDPNESKGGTWKKYPFLVEVPFLKAVVPYGGTNPNYGNWSMAAPGYGGGRYRRCSLTYRPYVTGEGSWLDEEVTPGGYQMHIPGDGMHELLITNGDDGGPMDGKPYPWRTKANHRIGCLEKIENGLPGEGFFAVTPNGDKYYFSHAHRLLAPTLVVKDFRRDPFDHERNARRLMREQIYLLATRVEDRFGNWVSYTYRRGNLSRIESNDGRWIERVEDAAGKTIRLTSSVGTWTWTPQGWAQPDGRPSWRISGIRDVELQSARDLPPRSGQCRDWGLLDIVSFPQDIKITHPSGAHAEYRVSYRRQSRDGVIRLCQERAPGLFYLVEPNYIDGYVIESRRVIGPGVPALEWKYEYPAYYSAGGGTWGEFNPKLPGAVQYAGREQKLVRVVGPGKQVALHTFGTRWRFNEGQLLKVEYGIAEAGRDSVLRSEETRYQPAHSNWPQPFPREAGCKLGWGAYAGWFGTIHFDRCKDFDTLQLPTIERKIHQDGAKFVQLVTRHDRNARPVGVQAESSAGYRKTETIEYHDDTALWVLGQVKRATTNGVETSRIEYGWKALPSRTYAFGKQQQTLGYYADGNLKSAKDGNGNTTTYSGWKRGIPQRITHADGKSRTAAVNDAGWIISTMDENGYKTCYGHDAMGRLSRLIHPSETRAGICDAGTWAATTQVFEPVARAEYGLAAGHWRQTTSTGNTRRVSYYDALWRPLLVREYDAANLAGTQRFSRFAYDHEGRTTFASYPGSTERLTTGIWTEYDALGRVTSVSQDSELGPLTTITQYRGDATGAYVRTVSPRGVVTVTRHQAFDQPRYDTPVLVDQGQNLTERVGIDFTRDVFGKPLSIRKRNAAGTVAVTRRFTYNSAQELCKIIEPETGTTVYGYDGAGNLAHSAMGLLGFGDAASCSGKGGWLQVKSRAAIRTYDARNRVKTLVFPDGRGNTTNTYTPDGLLASTAVDNDGTNVVTTSYGYNRRRLPTSERMQWGGINWGIGYGYDTLGHLASQSYPNRQSVHFAPNALGQATRAGTYATGVQYYPNGGMKQFTYGNGIVHTMTQNARQLPARSTDSNGVLDLAYLYDKHANAIGITDYTTGARQSRAMIYNGLDQLVRTTGPSFGTANYSYNVLDNLTSVKITAGSHARDHTYHYDSNNRLTSVTNTVGGATVVGLGYDVQGNLRNQNGRVFNFDFGNRLRGVNGVASYVYDGHGRRVRDYTTASKYSLYSQSGQLVFDNDGRAGKSSQYVYLGGSLVAVREMAGSVATVKYQHTDALGTPIAVTDAAKAIVQTSEYEPYGQLTNRPLTDGPGYTGHVQDAATGLTYMQQRYYDPKLGVFLSTDPVRSVAKTGAGFNLYRYGASNPYRFTDPDGRCEVLSGTSACSRNLIGRLAPLDRKPNEASKRTDMKFWPTPGHTKLNEADKPREGRGEFGTPRNTSRGLSSHTGIDIEAPVGARVVAVEDGVAINIRPNPSATYGNQVVISHGDGTYTQYAHLDTISVTAGSPVNGGEQIGTVGRSGNTPALGDSHLHHERRIGSSSPRAAGGVVVDPLPYLPEP